MRDQRTEFIRLFPKDEIERRKELVRKAWRYEKIDHIPVALSLDYNPWGYTMQEQLADTDKQFTLRMHACEQSLKLLPDDYIPCAFVDVGCVGISEAFGCTVYRGDNPDQTPGIRGHLYDSIEDTYDLRVPDVRTAAITKQYLERLRYFYERTEGSVYLSGLDNNGPMGVAMDLVGSEELFISMIEEPESVIHLLGVIDDTIIDLTEESIRILDGDINHMTSTDFFFCWCPEGKKGHASADLCTAYSRELFRKFDYYANGRIFEKYGPGLMHNCGPNPCINEYNGQHPDFAGLNLAYQYSACDLNKIKEVMGGKIIYFSYDFPERAIEEYRNTMETLAPEVIAIPLVRLSDESVDPRAYYGELRKISEEYAHRVFG